MNKMYRYKKWIVKPEDMKAEELLSDLKFYRFLRVLAPEDNELLDRIQDILEELTKRGIIWIKRHWKDGWMY